MKITPLVQVADVVAETRDGQPVFLLDLVDSWARDVLRFVTQASTHWRDDDPELWRTDDFVGTLHLRDRLKAAITGVADTAPLAAVSVTDELFRRFTVFDETDSLALSGHDVSRERWWWQRVPTAGPVARELAEWRARLDGQ